MLGNVGTACRKMREGFVGEFLEGLVRNFGKKRVRKCVKIMLGNMGQQVRKGTKSIL
jgi:hypothetical protein